MRYLLPLLFLVGCQIAPQAIDETPVGMCGCEHTEVSVTEQDLFQLLEGTPGGLLRARLGVVLDAEFTRVRALFGQDAEGARASCIQMLESQVFPVFKRDLNIEFEIVFVKVWEGEDPYSQELTDNNRYKLGRLLTTIRNWTEANHPEADVTLCFSERRLDRGAVGVASSGACRTGGSSTAVTSFNKVVAAHELGHCFGIGHDLSAGEGGRFYIMNPSPSRDLYAFSPRSKDHLEIKRPELQCLVPETPTEVPTVRFVRGDVDGNEALNMRDALFIANYVTGSEPDFNCPDAADVNDDGRASITDVLYLLRHVFKGGPQPPAPFPLPGFDPTSDSLGCSNG